MSEGRMTAEQTPDIEAVRRAVAGFVCNVANLPEPLQVPALGISMSGMVEGLTVVLAPVLAAAVREARAAELREAADEIEVAVNADDPTGDLAYESPPRWLRDRADRIAVDAPEGGA